MIVYVTVNVKNQEVYILPGYYAQYPKCGCSVGDFQ